MIIPIKHPEAIPRAVTAIHQGQLVVLPTDTVYGVACWPYDADAIDKLYAAKHRPPEKAIPVLLADIDDALRVARSIPAPARKLARHFWPGALTLTLPKRQGLPSILSAYDTVGVRVPDHDGCRALIRAAGGALAVTSANRSGEVSPTTVAAAAAQLGDAVTLYLDGGRTVGGTPSTVVSLHDDTFTIIRKGPIPAAMIANVLSS